MLIALYEGAEMIRHSVDSIVSVQMLEGQIKFSTDLEFIEMNKDQMIVIHENISHSELAINESVILLTLTNTLAENLNSL